MFNTKAQSGMVVFFILLVFGLVYFVGLAPAMGNLTYDAVSRNNVTGVEGFAFSLGFQIMILIFFIIALMSIAYYGLR